MNTNQFEISCGGNITCLTFEPGRACFLAADSSGSLRQWSATDRVQISRWTMKTEGRINAIAVSTDGRWMVSGGTGNKVTIWSTVTREREIEVTTEHTANIRALDISNDSTRFASVGSEDCTVQIFDITSGVKLGSLEHSGNYVVGVKFSPDANRIATATRVSAGSNSSKDILAVRVSNVSSGNKLFEINTGDSEIRRTNALDKVPLAPLAWSSDGQRLLVVIASHDHYYGSHSVGFWESTPSLTSRFRQIGQSIRSNTSATINCIAISHDGKHLACGHGRGITVHSLEGSVPGNYHSGILDLPLTRMSTTALESWIQGNRTETEAILSGEIAQPSKRTHDAIAICALMRAHLGQWRRALETTEMSLQIKPSPIGQIARVVALIGAGEQEVALSENYYIFWDCELSDVKLLMVINSILLFVCNKREQAICYLRRFTDTCDERTKDMYLQVLGMMYLKQGDYGSAIQTLHRVQNPFTIENRGPLMTIFIIFNWNFENLKLTAWQRACEKLYVTGSTKEVGETLLKMMTALHEPGEKELTHSRLLQEIINRSGDVTLLAWTGKSSACNSCLPSSPAVYSRTQLTFCSSLKGEQLRDRVTELRTAFPLVDALITYSSVTRLQRVRFTRFRLLLPCIVFHVKNLRKEQGNVYHAETVGLGDVEFTTSDVLDQPRRLVFVNPWIHHFREPRGAMDEDHQELNAELVSHMATADIGAELVYEPMVEEVQVPTRAGRASDQDAHTRALELIACLGQPFTALLLLKQPDGAYKRVGADNEIVVRGVENDVLRSIPIEVLEII